MVKPDVQATVAERLKALGVRGVLVQMAENGQLLSLKCEVPMCYRPEGRKVGHSRLGSNAKEACCITPAIERTGRLRVSPDHYKRLTDDRREQDQRAYGSDRR